MADHRSRHRPTPMRGRADRGRPVAVGVAAVGVTLVVGAAGALHLSGSTSGQEVTPASTVSASGATPTSRLRSTPAVRRLGSAEPGKANQVSPGGSAVPAGPAGVGGVIPGVGAVMMAKVPRDTRQMIVVSGPGRGANTNTVTLWERADSAAAWKRHGLPVTGRNGVNGWTDTHREGDRTSPIGVFSLTAAGGKLADPGTGLPYEFSPSFYRTATVEGVPMATAFDYVLAIDYNRLPGQPPSDPTRPLGEAAGGDIWLHVDHRSPTRGCVTLQQGDLVSILRWLTPAAHPMIVMGDAASLAATAPDSP